MCNDARFSPGFLSEINRNAGGNDLYAADAADVVGIGGGADDTHLAHAAKFKTAQLDRPGIVQHKPRTGSG